MSDVSRITRNFLYLLIGGIVASTLEFGAEIILARRLSDTGYGHWSYAQSVFIYLVLLTDLGLTIYGAREIARYRGRLLSILNNILALRILAAILVSTGLLVVTWFMGLSAELFWLYAGGVVILLALAWDPVFLFQGVERMAGIALWRVLNYLFFFIGVWLVVASKGDLAAVSWTRGVSYLLPALLFWLWTSKYMAKPSLAFVAPREWSGMLRVSLVIALSVLIVNVYFTFDTLVLGRYQGPEQVGWYAAAYRIVGQFMGLALMLQVVFGPVLSRYRDKPIKLAASLHTLQFVLVQLGGVISAILFLYAGPLIKLLYGPVYAGSVFILKGLTFSLLLFFLHTGYITLLLYAGKERLYFGAMSAGAAVNLLLNLAMVPVWGYGGALLATLISHVVILIAAWIFTYRVFGPGRDPEFNWPLNILFIIVLTGFLSLVPNALLACLAFLVVYCSFAGVVYRNKIVHLIRDWKFRER